MLTGEIQSLVLEKGFGFIKPATGGGDVFFHRSVVDAPFQTLSAGQSVQYALDPAAEKPRAQSVQVQDASARQRASRPDTRPSGRSQSPSRPAGTHREGFKHGFVTKLHRKKFRGFISSVENGPEFLFAAGSVVGETRFSRLQIGDYVQFLIAEPDPDDPKQPVAKAVRVIERKLQHRSEKQLDRHPKARRKKPTWR